MLIEPAQACPCDSGKSFNDCCASYINAMQYPVRVEQLMRSRYTAYVLKNEEYLIKSWHESTRPDSLDLQNDTTQWKKLKIISSSEDTVHFVAFFYNSIYADDRVFYLSEESEFIKDKRWFYLKGKELNTSELSKNMLCPCHSGKKFKRCCSIKI